MSTIDIVELPRTRVAAEAAGLKKYMTGEACLHGHIAPRDDPAALRKAAEYLEKFLVA